MSILLLIFMSDIFFLYLCDEGCSTFIINHFVLFYELNIFILKERMLKRL